MFFQKCSYESTPKSIFYDVFIKIEFINALYFC
jgi:hypothetical protein